MQLVLFVIQESPLEHLMDRTLTSLVRGFSENISNYASVLSEIYEHMSRFTRNLHKQ